MYTQITDYKLDTAENTTAAIKFGETHGFLQTASDPGSISVYASLDGVDFYALKTDSGLAITLSPTANCVIIFPDLLFGLPYLKFVSTNAVTVKIGVVGTDEDYYNPNA